MHDSISEPVDEQYVVAMYNRRIMYIHYGDIIVFMIPRELCSWLGLMTYLRLAETTAQDTESTQIFYFTMLILVMGCQRFLLYTFSRPSVYNEIRNSKLATDHTYMKAFALA